MHFIAPLAVALTFMLRFVVSQVVALGFKSLCYSSPLAQFRGFVMCFLPRLPPTASFFTTTPSTSRRAARQLHSDLNHALHVTGCLVAIVKEPDLMHQSLTSGAQPRSHPYMTPPFFIILICISWPLLVPSPLVNTARQLNLQL